MISVVGPMFVNMTTIGVVKMSSGNGFGGIQQSMEQLQRAISQRMALAVVG